MGKKRASNFTGLSHFLPNLEAHPQSNVEPLTLEGQNSHEPAQKRRKISKEAGTSHSRKYDVSELIPNYKNEYLMPEHLRKYFAQRKRLFSLYDSGCLLDEEGWYSVTPERIAQRIAERCRCDCILDAFCGVGGNAIAFAQTCERVIALDISPVRLALARHNAEIYGVADRIEFILADYLSFARSYSSRPQESGRKIDVVFLSPPWGGPEYLSGIGPTSTIPGDENRPASSQEHPTYSLASIKPVHGAELFRLTSRITQNIAYFLPRNTQLEEISALRQEDPDEMIEIEEEWMGSKLKALTVYTGGLVEGQEHIF